MNRIIKRLAEPMEEAVRIAEFKTLNNTKFEYTLDGFVCDCCGEKVYSDDGGWISNTDEHGKVTDQTKFVCEDCMDLAEEILKKEELIKLITG